MSYPKFHEGEEARVGPAAYDRRMVGRTCRIESIKPPAEGEWRYLVSTPSGMASIVLESTLQKQYELGDWRDMAYITGIWRPNRISR